MVYYAHSTDRKDKQDWQRLIDHLREVAEQTAYFASRFGAEKWGHTAGLLHDLGKYTAEFQRRLEGSTFNVDHSTAGAQALREKWPREQMAMLLAYVIAGHHSGLPNYGTSAGEDSCLARRLAKSVRDYSAAHREISIPVIKGLPDLQKGRSILFQFALFTRMLFSCLVDADSLNTERFINRGQSDQRKHDADFKVLRDRFNRYYAEHYASIRYPVDQHRHDIFQECLALAKSERGMFSLTLPTGSGKTMVSLGFALEHLIEHSKETGNSRNMQRIIYVIPYTSIIEQNAKIFREVLGESEVLEHHSNVQHGSETSDEATDSEGEARHIRNLKKLAEENWDMPVVVTTTVQFFESLFSNKRSQSRKLHNLANSVIVLDEAQMLYGPFFKPCLYALEELTLNYGCSVIMCTATQPPSADVLTGGKAELSARFKEIVQDPDLRYRQFERVHVRYMGISDTERLAAQMAIRQQALCIVNTRNSARELYERLEQLCKLDDSFVDESSIFHLSARMCPKNRMDILDQVRSRLDHELPCLLVSTQLIEAGVDVDFPYVFRELAGLDSIAQASGRCNRNKKQPVGEVSVFELVRGLPPAMQLKGTLTRTLLMKCEEEKSNALSLHTMDSYFNELNDIQNGGGLNSADAKEILRMTEEGGRRLAFPFATIAKEFRMIEDIMETVIVPYVTYEERERSMDKDSSAINRILDRIRVAPQLNRSLLRQLQPYSVQLYTFEFNKFRDAGELEEIRDGIWVLSRPAEWYSSDVGVRPHSLEAVAKENYIQ
ncbi:helicase Cas3 [compost metagenome]